MVQPLEAGRGLKGDFEYPGRTQRVRLIGERSAAGLQLGRSDAGQRRTTLRNMF